MKVGVWIDAGVFAENSRFYNNMIKLNIDFLVSDFPTVAMDARDLWYSSEKLKQTSPDSSSDLVRTNSKYKSYSDKSLDHTSFHKH